MKYKRGVSIAVSEIFGFLGRTLNDKVITEMENAGIDASGEEGEYRTVVTNGPIFHHEVVIEPGEHILREGYSFLELSVIKNIGDEK